MAELVSKDAATSGTVPASGVKWASSISTIASALLALATLFSLFFGAKTRFPPWFLYALTVLMVVIIYKYFEDSIRRMIQAISLRSFLREQHFQLLDFIQRFNELVTPRGEDSIILTIHKIEERSGQDIIDKDLLSYLDQFISNILLRMSEAGKELSVGEFKGIMNDLSTLIKFCSYFYFKKPLHVRGITDLNKEERKNIELARENFADFVRRYSMFYDEINGKLGSSARARFEIPKPLS
ncbi:hypothetical protein EHM92_04510, partial [bacterium]